MNIDVISQNRSFYQQKLNDMRVEIEKAKMANESRQALINEQAEASELYEGIKEYRSNLMILKSRLIKENDEFRTRRLSHLNDMITDGIASIFPEKNLSAEVLCNFKRKDKVELRLKGNGCEFIPHIGKGKLMQYLISFSAVYGIATSLGIKNIFIDEAFGVASQNNLPIIGDVINKKIVEDGMQVILVSQNPALYQDIPRRQFNLLLDESTGKAAIQSIEEF